MQSEACGAEFCFYHLVARWFPNDPPIGDNIAQLFKVASNGFPFLPPGSTVGFMGTQPFSSQCLRPIRFRSTNYNGEFSFDAFVTEEQCYLDIYDLDFDFYGLNATVIFPGPRTRPPRPTTPTRRR